MRGLLLGLGLGVVIGVTIAPVFDRGGDPATAISIGRLADGMFNRATLDPSQWPANEEVLSALFEHQGWDLRYSDASTIEVLRCISAGTDVACEMQLNLGWLAEPRTAEAVFEENAGQWHMKELKAR